MKPTTLLFAAAFTAHLAVSTTAWSFFYPTYHSFFPPHSYLPPGSGYAPPPTSGGGGSSGFPSVDDMTKCMQAMHGSTSCSPRSYDVGNCCTYMTGLTGSCSYIPYYQSSVFQNLLKLVYGGGSSPSPPSS